MENVPGQKISAAQRESMPKLQIGEISWLQFNAMLKFAIVTYLKRELKAVYLSLKNNVKINVIS